MLLLIWFKPLALLSLEIVVADTKSFQTSSTSGMGRKNLGNAKSRERVG